MPQNIINEAGREWERKGPREHHARKEQGILHEGAPCCTSYGHSWSACVSRAIAECKDLGPTPGRACPRRAICLCFTGYADHGWAQMEICCFQVEKWLVFSPGDRWRVGEGLDTGWEACACTVSRETTFALPFTQQDGGLMHFSLLIITRPELHHMQVCPLKWKSADLD